MVSFKKEIATSGATACTLPSTAGTAELLRRLFLSLFSSTNQSFNSLGSNIDQSIYDISIPHYFAENKKTYAWLPNEDRSMGSNACPPAREGGYGGTS
jgi:hypothetical protein